MKKLVEMKKPVVFFALLVLSLTSAFEGASQLPVAPGQGAEALSPVSLRLDDVDLHQVIDIIMAQTLNLSYVIDPAVKGVVNMNTGTTFQRSDLLPILETVLKINGATMIRTGNFYQIVPANSAVRQPLAVQRQAAALSPDDQIVIQVVRMKFASGIEMERLLRPFLSDGGTISIHDSGSILLVADRRSNLTKLLDIVEVFDSSEFAGERVRVVPVKNAAPRDLVEDLKTIFSGYSLSDKATAISFIPMDRISSVLIVTPNADVFPVVERWLTQLDQPQATAGIRTFIYKAKNSRAIDLQKVMSQLYSDVFAPIDGPLPAPAGVPAAGPVPPQVPTAGNPIGVPGTPQAQPAPSSATGFSSGVRIIADEINNALLIQATQQVYSDIERTLRELDVQRRQVLIDAQIYEVTLDDSSSLGISAFLQNRSNALRSTTASFATPAGAGGDSPSLSIQTFTPIGRTRELILFLNARENRTRIRTLSAPSVLATDNLPAEFQVGAEVPVPVSSSVTPVQSEGTNLFAQQIQFRNTGVILKVKPQINEGGGVTLEIQQEVSQAGANTTSGIVAPVIGKSSVNSTVVIDNGQTIALGGFIRESNDLDRTRVPIVGRLPIVGALFGSTTRGQTRTELIVLITPHVLENRSQAELATSELKAKLKEIQKMMK